MAEIAPSSADPVQVALARKRALDAPGAARARSVVDAPGLTVTDIVCTCGPTDAPFEERHPGVSIAVVLSGTFAYRGDRGRVLLTPGSVLLGEAERPFCCSHEYGEGDRCVAFHFEQGFFERIAASAGARSTRFPTHRLPPMRVTAPLLARVGTSVALTSSREELQEAACEIAEVALRESGNVRPARVTAHDERRAAESARLLEATYQQSHTLVALAQKAGASPFHFLRVFKRVTGTTPHQFLIRLRVRAAAQLLQTTSMRVTDVAYEVGFDDLSHFVHFFRREFGASPARFRTSVRESVIRR